MSVQRPLFFAFGLWMACMPGAASAASLGVNGNAAFAGSFGLEVTPSGCTDDADLLLEPLPGAIPDTTISGAYSACRTIAVDGVTADAATTLTAGLSIGMNEFSVLDGVVFDAVVVNNGQLAYVRDDSPAAEQTYNAEFALNLNNIALGVGDRLDIFSGRASGGTEQFRVSLTTDGLMVAARTGSTLLAAAPVAVPASGWFTVTLAYGVGAGTGLATISIDDGLPGGLSGLSNPTATIDLVRLGLVGGALGEASYGSYYLDAFDSWR
jgi:hypothetical protein